MSKIHYISNGQKTLRCGTGQLDAFLNQTTGDGKPVWKVVPDPNPPVLTEEEIILNDHSGQIAIEHIESGKKTWCEPGQLEVMLNTGWKKLGEEAPVPTPVSEVAQQDAEKFEAAAEAAKEEPVPKPWEVPGPVADLRKQLETLDKTVDRFWKSNGEVNITGIRELIPNVTRKEVDEAYPGLTR